MMSTSIKVGEKTKSKIEDLQAHIKLETGKKVTQEELLEKIVKYSISNKKELIDLFREKTVPYSEEQIEEFHEGISSSGEKLTEKDIDEIIYDQ